MSGRYYYCIVTSTVGSSKATATSTAVLLKVNPANYSILNSGKTTYYNTIDTAIAAAKTGGGDSGGGTIKVLNTVTDNTTASTNKTITIDTNGKTLTRNQSIITTGGTLTIEGNGTIYCNADTPTVSSEGGNITTSNITVRGQSQGINTQAGNSGKISVENSYIYSTGRSGMGIYSSGNINIIDSWIYTPVKDKNSIYVSDGSSSLTITNSKVGSGSTNTYGLEATNENTGEASPISYSATGKLTINNSRILSGPYGASAITIYKPITIDIIGDTCIYACNTVGKYCINITTSNVKVNFNSTGYFYCTATFVASSGQYAATFNITKGHFVSRNNKYMFYKSGAPVTSYASSSSPGNRKFYYMNAYNSTITVTIPDCYYYSKGV